VTATVFEPLEARHAAALHELWSDPEVVRFTNWELSSSIEDTAARILRIRDRYAQDPGRLGPFVVSDGESQFVGLIGIDSVEGEHELWYLVRRGLWGRGHGAAMVARMLEEARARGYGRLVATAVASNVASWRLLERHGFERVATVEFGFRRHGVAADLHRYVRSLEPAAAAVDPQTLDRAYAVLEAFGPQRSLPAAERLARHFPQLTEAQVREVVRQSARVSRTVWSLAERGGEAKLGRDAVASELQAAHPFLRAAGLDHARFLVNYYAWHDGHDR
jgi:RimJ/RimL family protein N-acetyltransferase